jgi:tetratricopeptide (TPR) repeat protein
MLVEHGICLSDLDRLDEAIERFETALSLEPDHGSALYNEAITLYRLQRFDAARETMERAYAAERDNPLTLAVLGAWTLADPRGDLDEALRLLYQALELVTNFHERGELGSTYASLVAEEVFESLWQNGRRVEAREVARIAGRRDWITPHMFETINRADHGTTERCAESFRVRVRAELGGSAEGWPDGVDGYTTDLTVIATDEDEARELTLRYLEQLEPSIEMAFDVNVVSRVPESLDGARARGVARIDGSRAYFRSSERPIRPESRKAAR